MTRILPAIVALALCAAFAAPSAALAQAQAKKQAPAARSGPLAGFGSNSKEPIRIEAARLQIFDKEQRAVYTGDVVAVQGKSTLRCSKLTIFYDQKNGNGAPQEAAPQQSPDSSIKRLVCDGPVSVVSCSQTATGDHGVYEAATDLVTLTGNVVLADGPNVQNGNKLVYNLKDGTATVTDDRQKGGRVGGIFVPGSDTAKKQGAGPGKAAAAKPAKGPDGCS
jgi:lipopolysaccharide export system protein LptA